MIAVLEHPQARAPRHADVILAIARMTWLEALRSRWAAILFSCVALQLAAAQFISAWALVEREHVVLAMVAPMARILAMLVMSLLTVSAVVREFNDRSIMLTLAAPLSRASWLLGKGLGFTLISIATAAALSAPIILLAPATAGIIWAISLGFELIVLSCAALLIACILRQIPASFLALTVFYLLSRLIGILMLIAERAPYEASAEINQLSQIFLKALAVMLPRLDLFTQSIWLFEPHSFAVLGPVITQSLIYCTLLWFVACLDLSKAEL